MAAGATGWFWTALARETGKIGHLYSPGDERHHYPWFAHFALDNGAFPLWPHVCRSRKCNKQTSFA